MKRIFIIVFCALLGLLTACASTTISGPGATASPVVTPAPIVPLPSGLATDLVTAQANLQGAVSIGVLPAADPALACINNVITQAGLSATAPPLQTFELKNSGLVSGATIVYIHAQQLKAAADAAAGLTVPVSCKTLIGQMVVDGAVAQNKALSTIGAVSLFK